MRAALVSLCLAALVSRAGAVCGDGTLDGFELCDDGPANGIDGCCSADCQRLDADQDGLCDAADPCTWSGSFRFLDVKEPKLTLRRLDAPLGQHRFRFQGTLLTRTDRAIDPLTNGVALAVHYFWGHPLYSATVPGGAGWRMRADGSAWSYRDGMARAGGITRVFVRRVAMPPAVVRPPSYAAFAFVVEGRDASFLLDAPDGTVFAELTLDGSILGGTQCAPAVFGPTVVWHCISDPAGRTVRCTAPRLGPCRVSDPTDMIVCDLEHAAEAENTYFAQTGVFYSGPCDALPGFVGTPGVTCNAVLSASSGFLIDAGHPSAFVGYCTWTGAPAPGTDALVCY
jgi:hypothetical protein